MKNSVIFCVYFVLCGVCASSGRSSQLYFREDGRPVVDLPQGRAVGIIKEAIGKQFIDFKSLPFALPPTHDRRFMAPEPADAWEGDLDASVDPLPCSQAMYDILSSEDCLYLNVYAPMNVSDTAKLPVMVYLYGGAYASGDIVLLYDRPYLLVTHDVIVVILQYRVGVLGFFSTGDSVAPGNQGLMDQTLALQWVQDNIEYFGGDSEKVTLFGESAGAFSVHYQLLTPSAEGLFHQAIMQSGNAFSPWACGREFPETALELATMNDCSTENSEAIVECLQKVWHVKLSGQYGHFVKWDHQPMIFAPRVDGVYIPDDPATLMRNGQYLHVPTIMGVNREEGSLITAEMYTSATLIPELMSNFTVLGPISLDLFEDEEPEAVTTAVYERFLGTDFNITGDNSDDVTRIYSERIFHIPHDWLTQEMATANTVYNYELHHRGVYSLCAMFKDLNMAAPNASNWVCHGDDTWLIFFGGILNEADQKVSDYITKLWTDFAKTGNPTPTSDLLGFQWTPTDASKMTHLVIQAEPVMADDYRSESRSFWESLPLRINKILH